MNVAVSKPRRLALIAGTSALAAMGLIAGCSTSPKETPAPSGSSSSPSVQPTEKYTGAVKPQPSFSDRGAMDSGACGPGKSKVNGVCG